MRIHASILFVSLYQIEGRKCIESTSFVTRNFKRFSPLRLFFLTWHLSTRDLTACAQAGKSGVAWWDVRHTRIDWENASLQNCYSSQPWRRAEQRSYWVDKENSGGGKTIALTCKAINSLTVVLAKLISRCVASVYLPLSRTFLLLAKICLFLCLLWENMERVIFDANFWFFIHTPGSICIFISSI